MLACSRAELTWRSADGLEDPQPCKQQTLRACIGIARREQRPSNQIQCKGTAAGWDLSQRSCCRHAPNIANGAAFTQYQQLVLVLHPEDAKHARETASWAAAEGWAGSTSVRVCRKATAPAVGARLSKSPLQDDQLCAPLLQLLVLRCDVHGEVGDRALILRSCLTVTCCATRRVGARCALGDLVLSTAAGSQDKALLAAGQGRGSPQSVDGMSCYAIALFASSGCGEHMHAASDTVQGGASFSGMQAALSARLVQRAMTSLDVARVRPGPRLCQAARFDILEMALRGLRGA